MSSANESETETNPPPIYIVSGGAGASGDQLVNTVLVQFPQNSVPVITVAHVRREDQLEKVVSKVEAGGGTIVHTLVDANLRRALTQLAQERNVAAIDLMGALFARLSNILGQPPLGDPGLYRRLNESYFKRVSAIEFAVTHDDGKCADDWPLAEIMLVGVSRVSKTPLSMFLSVQGWKVANVPLVMGLPLPAGLAQLDRRRVIGLDIEPGQLLLHRQQRQHRLGVRGPSAYTNPKKIFEEVEAARQVFKQQGFSVIDVTDKPIETSAAEIVELIRRRFETS